MKRIMRVGRGTVLTGWIVAVVFLFAAGVEAWAGEGIRGLVDVNLFAAAVPSAERFLMVGDRGKIFLSEDGAETWKEVDSGTKRALATVCFPDDRHGWAAGQAGVILHSEDGGRTWEAQDSGVNVYLLDMDFVDSAHGTVVGADSTVVVTTDGGESWENVSLGMSLDLDEPINLFAVVGTKVHGACVAGDRGRIFTTEDGGRKWVESKTSLYNEETAEGRILYAMTCDSGVLYAVGIDGTFAVSRDRGRTWVERATGFPGPELYCIDIVGGVGFAAGSGGHILRTTDGGSTWSNVPVPDEVTRFWLSGIDLHKTPAGGLDGLIVGQDGTFGRLRNGAFFR